MGRERARRTAKLRYLPFALAGLSTAEIVAFERAWHRRVSTPVLDDPFAQHLCAWPLRLASRNRALGWFMARVALRRIMPASMVVVARARYAERALERAVEDGVNQYVIVGAGLDSFAFRRCGPLRRVDIFEVDQPEEQHKKRIRVRRAGLEIGANHHFVSADLASESLPDALAGSPFDPSRPTFVSLLGVAYYLADEELVATAESIARTMGPGTVVVVDYLLDEATYDLRSSTVREELLTLVEVLGEPMRSSYSLREMDALMASVGLDSLESLNVADLDCEYRRQLGSLLYEIPGIFGIGIYRVHSGAD